jgi:hypothetical protein
MQKVWIADDRLGSKSLARQKSLHDGNAQKADAKSAHR